MQTTVGYYRVKRIKTEVGGVDRMHDSRRQLTLNHLVRKDYLALPSDRPYTFSSGTMQGKEVLNGRIEKGMCRVYECKIQQTHQSSKVWRVALIGRALEEQCNIPSPQPRTIPPRFDDSMDAASRCP